MMMMMIIIIIMIQILIIMLMIIMIIMIIIQLMIIMIMIASQQARPCRMAADGDCGGPAFPNIFLGPQQCPGSSLYWQL